MDDELKIGEFARGLGVNAKTVRYYESLGLLEAPERNAAGYRLYSSRDEERLRFILGAKALGLELSEIREVVTAWAGGVRPCGRVSQLLDRKLGELNHRITELQRFRDELTTYKARVDASNSATEVPCAHVHGVTEGKWSSPLPEAGLGLGLKDKSHPA